MSDEDLYYGWTYNGTRTEELKIEDISLSFVSFGADSCEITAHPDFAPEFGTAVEIGFGAQCVFRGTVLTVRKTNVGGRQHNAVKVAGPWRELESVQFKQLWHVSDDGEIVTELSGRVILNQTVAGLPQSAGAQITEALTFAAAKGVGVAVGTITGADIQLPYDETRDLTVAQVLLREQRFLPDLCSRFDYSVNPPTLNIGLASSSAAYTQSLLSETYASRDDLAADGVELEIERIDSVNGAQVRKLEIQSAGDTSSLRCIRATLNPAGGSFSESVRVVDVTTETLPTNLSSAVWWIARHPRLRGRTAADVVFVESATRSGTKGLPRITTAPIPDLTILNLQHETEVFRCVVDVTIVGTDGTIDVERGVELTMEYTSTDAQTQTYRYVEGFDSEEGEVVPADLAAQLLAHWSTVYKEGEAVQALVYAPEYWAKPGQFIFDSSRPIQTVTVSAFSNLLSLTFGPPKQLGAQDMADRLLPFRAIRSSSRFRSRVDGKAPASSETKTSVLAPAKYDSVTPGKKEVFTISKASGGNISLDSTAITGTGKMKPQPVLFSDASDAQQVLATQPTKKVRVVGMRDVSIQELDIEVLAYDIPTEDTLTEEIDIVTDVTYDATAHKFVKTVKKVRVIKGTYTGGDGEADIVTLVPCSCGGT